MKEIWKDIEEYQGLYQVSNLGRIKSFQKPSKFKSPDEYILKSTPANNGYVQVTLYKDKTKRKFLVHRLVAKTFIPNPNNYPQINHKDENRLNNSVENLEWCTAEYNNAYGTAKLRAIDTKSKPIEQVTFDGHVIAVYRSTRLASEILDIPRGTLASAVITHTQCKGYFWRYSSISF